MSCGAGEGEVRKGLRRVRLAIRVRAQWMATAGLRRGRNQAARLTESGYSGVYRAECTYLRSCAWHRACGSQPAGLLELRRRAAAMGDEAAAREWLGGEFSGLTLADQTIEILI